jgi:hypothetical protein
MVQKVWSFFEGPSSSVSSLDSQQSNQSLVNEVIVLIASLANKTLILGGDASLYHVLSHYIQTVVEEVVMPMQFSANPTLLLESDHSSTKVVEPMQSSVDPTLLSRSDAYFDYVFRI